MAAQKSWNVWLDEEVEQLKRLIQQRHTYEEIARIMNRSTSSVRSKTFITFGACKSRSEEDIRNLCERERSGESCRSIANSVGLTTKSLYRIYKKAGHKINKKTNIDVVKAAVDARSKGVAWKDIPAYIGSNNRAQSIQVAISRYKKKSGS